MNFIPNPGLALLSAFLPFIPPRGVTLPGSKRSLPEQVHLPLREPIDHLGLRQQAAVLVNVADRNPGSGEGLADQFAAMALLRPALAAHQRHAALQLEGLSEPLDSALEKRLRADLVVIHLAVRVTYWVLGLPAERVAHEHVVDARAFDMVLKKVSRELRSELRVRRGANVNEILDVASLKRRQELRQRARPVANREKRVAAARFRRHRRPRLFTAF